jgi:sulfur carrier protein ThiS
MNLTVELFPQRREVSINLPGGSSGLDLMRALRLAPDVHILVRDGSPIAIDEELREGDRVRVIAVVSGG